MYCPHENIIYQKRCSDCGQITKGIVRPVLPLVLTFILGLLLGIWIL